MTEAQMVARIKELEALVADLDGKLMEALFKLECREPLPLNHLICASQSGKTERIRTVIRNGRVIHDES